MEIMSMEFLSALMAIVIIDLALAGDNAIVIALAARNVPKHLQQRAILWGTVGAIAVRTSMTLIVVWLLKIPGLLFAGGALLVWIAYKLLLPEAESEAGHDGIKPADTFWGALKTIVIADLVMGLDNVLAVAGAAHGSFLLVVLGLLISIPIVVWGSTFLLKYVERYPGFVYLGSGVLAWTAAKMMSSEPLLKDALNAHGFTVPMLYVVTIFGVLWAGLVANHRRLESRIGARVASLARSMAPGEGTQALMAEPHAPIRILMPIDGSANSVRAVRRVIEEFATNRDMELHLLNVQTPFSSHIAQFASRKNRESFHHDEAQQAMGTVRPMLDAAGVPYAVHAAVGKKAQIIADTAQRLGCHHIVMGTARRNSVTRMLEASVTNQVIELSDIPVEVVPGDAVSTLEQLGIPAGVCAMALLLAIKY